MRLLEGKKALIFGISNERSIAYGISKCLVREGADLYISCQNDKLKEKIQRMQLSYSMLETTDISVDKQIDNLFNKISDLKIDKIDILIHSVAFANTSQLSGRYIDSIDRNGFNLAHEMSSYSLTAVTKHALPYLIKSCNGSVLTVSYIGAIRSVKNYNVMGIAKASLESSVKYLASDLGEHNIRVNAISPGPVRTLAASAINGFRNIMSHYEKNSPLKRCASLDDIGNTAVFLSSDWASGITGETIYVDCGFRNSFGEIN